MELYLGHVNKHFCTLSCRALCEYIVNTSAYNRYQSVNLYRVLHCQCEHTFTLGPTYNNVGYNDYPGEKGADFFASKSRKTMWKSSVTVRPAYNEQFLAPFYSL